MTNYFSAMVISSSTDNRLKLRENNSQADAATNLIDIEAGGGVRLSQYYIHPVPTFFGILKL